MMFESNIKTAYANFKRISFKIAEFQSRILLSIFYFTFLSIFALIIKSHKNENKSFWYKWTLKSNNINDVKKQY